MEIRASKESEFEEIINLICTVFVEKCRPRYASQIYHDSSFQPHQSRVCVVDGKIVSHIRVSDRAIHIGHSIVRLGGIGMVATLPEYRHRGYASALMQDSIVYMEKIGYELSLLFTTIQPFYMKFGWATFPQTNFELELGEKKQFEPSPWRVRAFDAETDLVQISQIYDEHNKIRSGTILRSKSYWRDTYSHQVGILPSLVAERDGTIGAYANFGFPTDLDGMDPFLATYYPNLREVGYHSQYPDSLLALCHAILTSTYKRDLTNLSGRLHRYHPLITLLSEESGSQPSFSTIERAMYRIVSLSSLFQKMIPEFEKRLAGHRENSIPTSFCFILESQVSTLKINQGKVTVTNDNSGGTKVRIDTHRFLKVLFGDATFSQLEELNHFKGLRLEPNDIVTLDTLFPKGESMHWICDYF